MSELAILLDSGVLVRDSGWGCIADVMRSHRNFIPTGNRAHGVLVDAATLVPIYPPPDVSQQREERTE